MQIIKHFFILALALATLSCSLVKTAYNNAPVLIAWRLDDYFNFSETQKAKLKPALICMPGTGKTSCRVMLRC